MSQVPAGLDSELVTAKLLLYTHQELDSSSTHHQLGIVDCTRHASHPKGQQEHRPTVNCLAPINPCEKDSNTTSSMEPYCIPEPCTVSVEI